MKKVSSGVSALMLLMPMLMPNIVGAQGNDISAGKLVKAKSSSAVYYVDADMRRYAFPNAKVFNSWYADFSGVVTLEDSELSDLPLGGLVPYKAAKRLVKVQTDPKVYAVDDAGVLRWVKSEAIARALYGDNWKTFVDDLSDAFFAGYTLGADVDAEGSFDLHKFALIKEIAQTLRADRIKRLMSRGAGEDEIANEGFGKNKVAICHKPGTADMHTLYLPTPALSAHLGHGDTRGACAGTTTGDTTAPVVSASAISDITATGAKVTLTTDEQTTAKAFFSLTTPVNKETATSVSSATLGTSHTMTLTGLQAASTYHVLITATDAAGNVTTVTEKTFTTLAASTDTTAPTVTASSIDAITATGAMVHVTANEDVKASVFYGTTNPVNVATATHVDKTTLDDSQDLALTGLTANTPYFAVIVVTDAAGNKTTVAQKTFTTLASADTTAPTVTASSIDAITAIGATAHVTANENVTASVFYGTTSPVNVATATHVDVATLDDSQDLAIVGLTPDTAYFAVIVVTDAAGNKTTVAEKTFTTLALDTTSPTATASSINAITATGATAHVEANENVSVVVYYSTATPVNTGTADHVSKVTLDDSQDVAITGLTASTAYHAVIVITDASGNTTVIAEKTFTTLAS